MGNEMRRFILIGSMLILASATAFGQATPPAGAKPPVPAAPAAPAVPGTKVAVIDFEQALLESDAGKAAQAAFNKEMEPEKAKFDQLGKEVDDLSKKLQDAKTDAEKAPIRAELEKKNKEAQRLQQDAEEKSAMLRQKLLGPIAKIVNDAVDKYSKENNLALVLDPNTDPSNVIYSSKASDITSDVMRIMNAEYAKDPKIAAPAATPAAPAAKPNN